MHSYQTRLAQNVQAQSCRKTKCLQNCFTAKCRCNSGRDARDWDPSEGKTPDSRPHRHKIASKLPSSTFHQTCKTCTAQLRASAHDYLKKTPGLSSQSILPSISFALAQQASRSEHSKAFTRDENRHMNHMRANSAQHKACILRQSNS